MKQLYRSWLLSAFILAVTATCYSQTYTITYTGLTGNTNAQGVPTGITVTTPYNGVQSSCNTASNGATTSYTLVLTAAPGYNFTITSVGGAAYASSAGSKNFSFQLINGSNTYTSAVTSIGTSSNCGGNTALTPLTVPSAGQLVTSGSQVTIKVLRAPGSASGGGYSWTRSLTVTGTVSPACTAPSALTATNITTTGADLGWTAASGVPDYEYAVSTSATPPSSGTAITGISAQATNLIPGTSYYLHVRSNCGTAFSGWQSIPFTTLSAPVIATDAHDSTTCKGGSAAFMVTALNATGYQWQELTTSWSNLTNNIIYNGATTANLIISDVTGLSGNKYRCIVTGANLPNDTSYAALLSVKDTVNIITQPLAAQVCAGNDTSFALTATDALFYQWQVKNGATFVNVVNNTTYAGATNDTLSLHNPTATMNGNQYRCIAFGTCGVNDTSNTILLTVNAPAVITQNPHDSSVCDNANVAFAVAATGSNLNYQWQFSYDGGFSYINVTNTLPYSGVNDDTLTITGVVTGMNGFLYRCIVNGSCTPPDTSNGALLNINIPLLITTEPLNITGCQNENTYLATAAIGANLTYRWQIKNGATFSDLTNSATYTGTSTDTLHISNVDATLDGQQYRCIISSACAESDTTQAAMITVQSKGLWTGNVSSSWSDAANWGCSYIPTGTTDVTINSTAAHMPAINTTTATCRNLTINAGASLSFTGTANSVSITGNLVNHGNLDATGGKVILSGSAAQSVAGANYKTLEINGNGDKTVTDGNMQIGQQLILTNGKLILGNYDIVIKSAAAINGGGQNAFIVTNGAGKLVQQNIGTSGKTGSILFPVGSNSTSYTPVSINNNGVADTFSARVIDHFYSAYTGDVPSGTVISNNVVDKTWLLSESNNGGTDAAIQMQWNAADEASGFIRTACYGGHYYGGFWQAGSLTAASGSNPYTLSLTSVTSFSPFGIGSNNSPLPLVLVSFGGKKVQGGNLLTWETATESEVTDFDIERSFNGSGYEKIGNVLSANNAENSYSFMDQFVSDSRRYYRLKVNEQDGGSRYSNVVVMDVSMDNSHTITLYPNPVSGDKLYLNMLNTSGAVHLTITDMTGKVYHTESITVNKGAVIPVSVYILPAGTYLLQVTDGQMKNSQAIRFDKL